MKIFMKYFVLSFLLHALCFSQAYIVAVTPFEVNGDTEKSDVLGYGIPQSIANDLSCIPDIQVVERLQLSAVLQELQLQQTGLVNTHNAASIGELLGANLVVVGSVQDIRGMIRIHVRIVQTATGKVVLSVEDECKLKTINDYFTLEDRITKNIIKKLGFQIAELELDAIEKKATDSDDAFQAYSSALKYFDSGDFVTGFNEIDKAQREDPAFDWTDDIRTRAQKAFEELEREAVKIKEE